MAMEQAPQAAPAEGGGGEDQLSALIGNITDGLAMLSEVMGAVSPESASELEGVSQAFQGVVTKAMSGGGASAAPQGQGVASAQVGAGKAIPAGPQGVARG